MNRINFTLLFCLLLSTAIGQTFQGTIKPGTTSSSVICAIKPSGNYADKPTNIQFTIAIPTTVGARPAMTILDNKYPGIFNQVSTFGTANYGTDYIYLVNMAVPTLTTTRTYNANVEDAVVELSFAGLSNVSNVRLVQLPDGLTTTGAGSENGNYNFYVEFAAGGEKTNTTAMFYSTTGGTVINSPLGYSGYSSVSAGTAPLPVKWLSFSAEKVSGNALVKWEVANQLDNDYFEVEVATDGRSFRSIGKVSASNNNTYTFTDVNLSKLTSAFAYYRIKQVDKDGKFTYSEIKKLQIAGKGFAFGVVTNPIKGSYLKVSFDAPQNNKGTIRIFDINGKQVYANSVAWNTGYSEKDIQLPSLASGSYFVTLASDNDLYQAKFVK